MTEADLLAQLNSTGAFVWSLMQYWTSISIGILVGAVELCNTAVAVLEYSPMANDTLSGQFFRMSMFVGMFLITISNPVYCKFKSDD